MVDAPPLTIGDYVTARWDTAARKRVLKLGPREQSLWEPGLDVLESILGCDLVIAVGDQDYAPEAHELLGLAEGKTFAEQLLRFGESRPSLPWSPVRVEFGNEVAGTSRLTVHIGPFQVDQGPQLRTGAMFSRFMNFYVPEGVCGGIVPREICRAVAPPGFVGGIIGHSFFKVPTLSASASDDIVPLLVTYCPQISLTMPQVLEEVAKEAAQSARWGSSLIARLLELSRQLFPFAPNASSRRSDELGPQIFRIFSNLLAWPAPPGASVSVAKLNVAVARGLDLSPAEVARPEVGRELTLEEAGFGLSEYLRKYPEQVEQLFDTSQHDWRGSSVAPVNPADNLATMVEEGPSYSRAHYLPRCLRCLRQLPEGREKLLRFATESVGLSKQDAELAVAVLRREAEHQSRRGKHSGPAAVVLERLPDLLQEAGITTVRVGGTAICRALYQHFGIIGEPESWAARAEKHP